jgi:hypothetical protein
MRKTLGDVAEYLQSILAPETNGTFTINPLFKNIANDEKIREGVFAFRQFLHQCYGALTINSEKYDSPKKVAHEYENRISLSVYYPFLHNAKNLLLNIALQGVWENNHQSLICSGKIFDTRISTAKSIECLQFLHDCGLQIDGINLEDKKQYLPQLENIIFSFPKNDAMLIGLKVMAIAEAKLGTLENQDIFLRCDYHVLKNDELASLENAVFIIKHATRFLSNDVRNFIFQLHQTCTEKGYKPLIEIKGFWIIIKYVYKRKEMWGFNVSLANGIHINVKAQNMDKYRDAIETFPPVLREVIEKGYGCGRKRSGVCDGGCRGMIIPLNDSDFVLSIKTELEYWFEQELQFA